MSNRGRPRKPEAVRKSEPVSIRLTPELRARLEAERTEADPPLTLSQVIEARLRESFELDNPIQKSLGGSDYHYWLLRIIAEVILRIEQHCRRQFVNDQFTFEHVKLGINTVLDRVGPQGIASPPEWMARMLEEQVIKELGKWHALFALSPIGESRKPQPRAFGSPDCVDPIAAGKYLFKLIRRPVTDELFEFWFPEGKHRAKPTS
jgi:hypothetical protein